MAISSTYAKHIDLIVTSTNPGQIIEFGKDIALQVYGKIQAGGVVGKYIYENRYRLHGWWRVVNSGGHPVADDEAISLLKAEGHTIHNGTIK